MHTIYDDDEQITFLRAATTHGLHKAGNTRLEMTADLREKDQHILKSTSMKQQENPADFSSVHKVSAFFAQICCPFTPCISRLSVFMEQQQTTRKMVSNTNRRDT